MCVADLLFLSLLFSVCVCVIQSIALPFPVLAHIARHNTLMYHLPAPFVIKLTTCVCVFSFNICPAYISIGHCIIDWSLIDLFLSLPYHYFDCPQLWCVHVSIRPTKIFLYVMALLQKLLSLLKWSLRFVDHTTIEWCHPSFIPSYTYIISYTCVPINIWGYVLLHASYMYIFITLP